ncbi:MAG TPA: hypothetical protein VNG33_01830 [Polyangiaceae bacterium]|nr:hypothetical protein [Polyangiaceae bacterium]
MSVGAIALLRHFEEPAGAIAEDGWKTVNAPGIPTTPFKVLKDAAIVMLGLPFVYPDADLYAQSVSWLPKSDGKLPRRIWVFSDESVPDLSTAAEIERATKAMGRWVSAGKKRSPFEALGFTAREHRDWLKEAMSGDPLRVKAAREGLEKRLAGHTEEEINAMLENFLRRD